MWGRRLIPASLQLALGAWVVFSTAACSFDDKGPAISPPRIDGHAPVTDTGPADGLSDGIAADRAHDLPLDDARADRALLDSEPVPDSTVDMLPPGVFLDEHFVTGAGEVTFEQGSWSWSASEGGTVTQGDTTANGNYALFDAPNGLIGAETLLRINVLDSSIGTTKGAGLGFRVHAPTAAGAAPQMVACYLSPNTNTLGIAVCDGIHQFCAVSDGTFFALNVGVNYRLRGELSEPQPGNVTLTCQLVGQKDALGHDVKTSAPIGAGAGDVALVTFFSDTTFFELKVYQPPL